MFLAPDQSGAGRPRDDSVESAISDEIERIQALHHGHRPAAARTIWRENVVVCVLEGVFTTTESRRVATGEFERVRGERVARRGTIEPLCRALVESVTGRPVRAYMPEVAPEGFAFEAFILG